MGIEIERRFIVNKALLPDLSGFKHLEITQGYLTNPECQSTVRIRLKEGKAILGVKSYLAEGINHEFEYEIPEEDAKKILWGCPGRTVYKTRVEVPVKGLTFEVDFFHSNLEGLILAEVELDNLTQEVEVPSWCSREITGEREYSNQKLAYSSLGHEDVARIMRISTNLGE